MNWRVTSLGVGVGALLAWWAWRRAHSYPETPIKWEEVGEVSELVIYPLKSGCGVKVTEAEATRYGLAHGLLEDRSFAAIASRSGIIMGKFNRKMFSVTLTLDGSMVTLQAREEEEEEVQFDLQDVIRAGKIIEITEAMKGYDCGDEASAWLTRVIHVNDLKGQEVRLAYNGDLTQNHKPSEMKTKVGDMNGRQAYPQFKPSDRIVYAQHAAYMLASETSLADLNTRLLKPVTLDWFRPNLVVRGVRQPYDEDDWAFVRIGDVVFRRVKPCTKYVFRYVEPRTPQKYIYEYDDYDEVLSKTIHSTRKLQWSQELQNHLRKKPVFGSHLGIDTCGKVRVGDKVAVARASSNPRWQL